MIPSSGTIAEHVRMPSPRLASSTFFAVMGFVSAGWIARIPAVTNKLDLDTGTLGILLLFIAVGSLMAFQFIGRLVERFGSGPVTFAFSLVFIGAYVLLALSPHPLVLGACLFIYGLGFGSADVAMNAQGVAVERTLGKSILGSLHGCFSLGALVGAAGSSLFASAGIGLEPNLISFAIVATIAAFWANRGQIPDPPMPETEAAEVRKPRRFALPPRVLWPLGVVAFFGALGEGAMADWGALYINQGLGASEALAAFAFTIFSLTMLVGRFATDKLANRFDPDVVVRVGSAVAAIGLASGVIPSHATLAIAGYAVMGLGLACIFPLVYSAAGSMPGVSSGRGVAAAATMAYTAFLIGPPVLGFIARQSSIQVAMLIVAAGIAIIPLFAWSLRRSEPDPAPQPTA